MHYHADSLKDTWISVFLYRNEGDEPAHIHVEKGSANGKIWLDPIVVEYFHGFSTAEEKRIMNIINENVEDFINQWNAHF